jgi:hypothetical protein
VGNLFWELRQWGPPIPVLGCIMLGKLQCTCIVLWHWIITSLHVSAGVAGFCCTALLLKMPFTFTNKEYDYIYFVYTLSIGSCRASITEYQWQYPGCWVTNFRILRDNGSFPWVNVLEKTLFWMQCSKTHINCVQRISTWTGAAFWMFHIHMYSSSSGWIYSSQWHQKRKTV